MIESSYEAVLEWLYGLQMFGMKLGLENIRALCKYFGDPQNKYPVIHIAGTNGKGSTSALITSVLRETGASVGLYTSPHLVAFNERIRVNGAKIPEGQIVEYARLLRPKVDQLNATFFEATTVMAFQYFAERGVDAAVIETGLGGRLDATNVVTPVLSVITSIGLDHTEHLGESIEAIASEKAGIIKHRVPCVTGARQESVIDVFRAAAALEHAPFIIAYDEVTTRLNEMTLTGMNVDVLSRSHSLKNVISPFIGMQQMENIATAICAAEQLQNIFAQAMDNDMLVRGIENALRNSHLRCRFETLRQSPLTICDVAHNPPGFTRLVETLNAIGAPRMIWVMGVMQDKDYRTMLQTIAPVCDSLVCVQPALARALNSMDLKNEAQAVGIPARDAKTVANGIEIATARAEVEGLSILITGSHFVAGEALSYFGEEA